MPLAVPPPYCPEGFTGQAADAPFPFEIFQAMDSDGDGVVSFSDIAGYAERNDYAEGYNEQHLVSIFKQANLSGNGRLTIMEAGFRRSSLLGLFEKKN